MTEGKVVYEWGESTGESQGDETSSVGEAELLNQAPKSILRPPPMPSALQFGKEKEKAVSFEEKEADSWDAQPTISTSSEPAPKRGRGRPKKNSPLTSQELRQPLTPHQVDQTQKKIDDMDKKREAHVREEKKKAVEEEIARRAKVEAEGDSRVSSALDDLEALYRFWPQYKDSCPRKGAYTPKTPLEEILKEIKRIDDDKGGNRAYNTICNYHVFFMKGIEELGIQAGQPMHGLTDAAKRSQIVVEDELKEMSIKYKRYLTGGGPEIRYLQSMAYLAYCVRSENVAALKKMATQGMTDQARRDFEEKYGSL